MSDVSLIAWVIISFAQAACIEHGRERMKGLELLQFEIELLIL
jgi:hypothetical protein